MKITQLIDQFQRARSNHTLAVIEGVQALKHAARFHAEFVQIITSDVDQINKYLDELAVDVKAKIISQVHEVEESVFQKLSPQPPRTKIIAIATRKQYSIQEIDKSKPIVLLEDPRDLENIGAVIRVCAAADIAAVCITGPADIWHPAVLRGGAGLHFALPVFNIDFEAITVLGRKIISLDPTGENLEPSTAFANAILVFGTERHGISKATLQKSDEIIRLPMRSGVSSLNLATSVAATLYADICR